MQWHHLVTAHKIAKKTCHCLLQHHVTAFTVRFSRIPLVCQGHHLKTCNMASESGGGTSGCFPTAAVVLAKLGCMPQSIDQSGLSAIRDACMQTLAKCRVPKDSCSQVWDARVVEHIKRNAC